MAIAIGCVIPALAAGPAHAGSGEPASSFLKKKKIGDSSGPASSNWNGHAAGAGGKAITETGLVTDGAVSPFLAPDSTAQMQAAIAKYEQIVSAGGWPSVPAGKYKKGSTGKGVAALNQRLFVEGYLRAEATQGEFAETFTTATEEALDRFQRYHGLAATGAMDGSTLRELNVSASQRLATLRANAPRVAEYSKDLGDRYMVVNVPAMQIETVNGGRVYSRHNAIVGRPSRPTPVVMTPLATVRFNPYWNAPPSIVEKDLVPRMLSSGASKVMREMNMKIFKGVGGPEIDPNSVNWRRAVVDNYHFRQEPGGSNAMATAKIEFNSPFGIYLHDTPEPHLFATGQRFYSSGCVRVEKVAILINWILQGQDGITPGRISELAESKERLDTAIANPPQLRVAYLTAWPTRDGVAAFRPDVYELDGSGFVLGQPLPVGEKVAGLRYVLKPIARSPSAVEEDEAFGFASLFRSRPRNTDKEDVTSVMRSGDDGDDSLAKTSAKSKAKAKADLKQRSKTKTASASKGRFIGSRNSDKMEPGPQSQAPVPNGKKVADKTKNKKKLAAATKTGGKAKKETAKTQDVASADKKATGKSAKDSKAAAVRKPASCKADKDGKLPEGCKTAAVKKPATKPEKKDTATD